VSDTESLGCNCIFAICILPWQRHTNENINRLPAAVFADRYGFVQCPVAHSGLNLIRSPLTHRPAP